MTFYHKLELKSTTLVSVIFNSLEEEILMSDNYGDKGCLNLISKLGGGVRGLGSFNSHMPRVPTSFINIQPSVTLKKWMYFYGIHSTLCNGRLICHIDV